MFMNSWPLQKVLQSGMPLAEILEMHSGIKELGNWERFPISWKDKG